MDFYIALQLYTVSENLEKNFIETIKEIKMQGYDGVELAGCYGFSAQDLKSCLTEYQLNPISAHVPIEDFSENIEKTLDYYKQIGCQYIVIPYLDETFRYGQPQYNKVLKQITDIEKACRKMNLHLLYHNHDFEFEQTKQGTYPLDELYQNFSPEQLQAELDTCWIAVAGESPVKYIEKYANRCPLIHLKDFVKEDEVILKPLGEGIQDFQNILYTANKCGVKWIIVEQDTHYSRNPLENTKISINYLKGIKKWKN